MKNAVFMGVVGKEYIPWARIGVLLLFIPAILLYSKLVDNVRRYHLLVAYSIFYSFVALALAFFVGHSTIGIGNTSQSPYRLFGWIFYFLVEGYSPFVLSVFWAFVGSISNPDEAKKNYGIMVGGSKLGGMFSSGLAWLLLSATTFPIVGALSSVGKHQLMLAAISILLMLIPIVVKILMSTVSGRELHGYEAVYKVEKKRSKAGKSKTGIFAGLKMFTKYPYVLGIFFMIFFYDILATLLSYLRLHVAQTSGNSIADVSMFLFKWVFIMQACGFVVSTLGTPSILKRFGARVGFLLIPLFMAIGALVFFFSSSVVFIMIGYTITKTMHYAFAYPVRELLYIPTLKEIKFKSKSWIDAFGTKFAKFSGGTVNIFALRLGAQMFYPFIAGFFTVIIGLWFVVAFFLGLRYDRAIKNNEVIGHNDEGENS